MTAALSTCSTWASLASPIPAMRRDPGTVNRISGCAGLAQREIPIMAWIVMRHDLADDPAVLAIAAALKLPTQHVIGGLHGIWSWFDAQTVDGNAPSVTSAFLDARAGALGFAQAMAKVGWLCIKRGAVSVPNFNVYMSQSAKARALSSRRVKRHRNGRRVTNSLPQQQHITEQNRKEAAAQDLPADCALAPAGSAALPAGGGIELLVRAGFDQQAARKHAAEFTEDQIVRALETLAIRMRTRKVPNPQGLLVTLMRAARDGTLMRAKGATE